MLEDFARGLKNEASVFGQVAENVPGAVWDEIKKDWQNHRTKLLAKEGVSLALGIGAGLALARSPFMVKGVLGALGIYQGCQLLSSAGAVAGRAWHADTDASRRLLVNEATAGISTAGAGILETTPTFLLGGGVSAFAGSRFAATRGLALSVREQINDPLHYNWQQGTAAGGRLAREAVPTAVRERLAWLGPGTRQLPESLLAADGKINILETARLMKEMHPWRETETLLRMPEGNVGRAMLGREQWASVRLSDMKVSRTYTGSDLEVKLPFPDREGRISFHTHPPEGMSRYYPVSGARPSVEDLKATMETGIIQSGTHTTIYQGAAREFLQSQVGKTPFQPELRAIILDPEKQLAAELCTEWAPATGDFIPTVARPLDYAETQKVLSAWDRKWSSISEIPTDHQVMSRFADPHVFEFLKLGVYKRAGS